MLDLERIRNQFPLIVNHADDPKGPLVYFDNAATTLKPQPVIDTVNHYYTHESVNIHRGDYDMSFHVSEEYEKVRDKVASLINCEANEVVFTSGASDSLNLVAVSLGQLLLSKGDVILVSEAEHASNLLPWFECAKQYECSVEYIPLEKDGQMKIERFKDALHPRVKICALASVTNVLGYHLNMKEISRIAHENGSYVVCDGAQSVPHCVTDVQDMGVDFLAFSAHKMCGPTGVGVLYGRFSLLQQMQPIRYGGGSNARYDMCGSILLKDAPYKFESGTPAIEGVLGLGAAIDYLQGIGFAHIVNQEKRLHRYAIKQLQTIDHVQLVNPEADAGIIAFNIRNIFPQDVGMYLNSLNIAVRTGNHCSKILFDVIGVSETVRVSVYFYNTFEEVDRFIEGCRSITLEKCIDLYL